jgi:hypothetical protein
LLREDCSSGDANRKFVKKAPRQAMVELCVSVNRDADGGRRHAGIAPGEALGGLPKLSLNQV